MHKKIYKMHILATISEIVDTKYDRTQINDGLKKVVEVVAGMYDFAPIMVAPLLFNGYLEGINFF